MAGFARLILHDRRGTGLSDSDGSLPTLEQQVDDLRAVLAAGGSERTAIIGGSDLGLSTRFAATYPDQVTGLVLSGVAADGQDTLGGSRELLLDAIERSWGDGTLVSLFAPSQVDNRDFVQWWGRMQRSAVTPGMARKLMDMTMQTDVEEFLTGRPSAPARDRVLATVLFTDIVDSTSELSLIGDSRWRERLEDHDRIVRAALDRWRGREIKTSGDGFLATFDGPARGVRCAAEIVESVAALGLSVRTGPRTGECETTPCAASRIRGGSTRSSAEPAAVRSPREPATPADRSARPGSATHLDRRRHARAPRCPPPARSRRRRTCPARIDAA
jgi:pimeloyl-ACP methyl ester carboxylesterase